MNYFSRFSYVNHQIMENKEKLSDGNLFDEKDNFYKYVYAQGTSRGKAIIFLVIWTVFFVHYKSALDRGA